MFQLQHVNEQWQVLSAGSPVFIGTMRQVEDWLDQRENVARSRSSRRLPNGVFVNAIHRVRRWVLDHLWHQHHPGTT